MKLLIFFMIFTTPVLSKNTVVTSFGKAKAELRKIYGNKNKTFYCDCSYQKNSIKAKCDLNFKKFKKRQKRLEWEHVVPAHAFGQSFKEWRQAKDICPKRKNKKGKFKKVSNRKCASKKNKLFRSMESDIYNIVPAVGAVNALRSNFSMDEFTEGKTLCKDGIQILNRKVMPSKEKRGDVARIYLYMHSAYPGRGIVSNKNKSLFEKWNLEDPVDSDECNYYIKKKKIQKNPNPILESLCFKK